MSKKSTKPTKSKFSSIEDGIKILDLIDEDYMSYDEKFEETEEFQIFYEQKLKEIDDYNKKIEFCLKSFNSIKEHLNFYTLPIGNNLSIEHLELLLDKIT